MKEKAFEGALLYKVIRKPHEENSKKTRPKSHAGGQGQWQKWLTMHLGRRIEEVIQKQPLKIEKAKGYGEIDKWTEGRTARQMDRPTKQVIELRFRN